MRKRPTRQAAVVAGAGLLLILAGVTAQAGWLFVIAAGVLALVAGSFVTRHRLRQVAVERSVPSTVRVGDDVRVGLAITNTGSRPTPLFHLEDRFAAFGAFGVGAERIEPGSTAFFEAVLSATRRGDFRAGEMVARSAAPFGFALSSRRLSVISPVVVVPRWVELPSFPILEPSSSPSDVLHERARTGAGEEYLGLRDYRPGDPRRFVHWRSTARAGRLVVREYEKEASSRVAVVLAGVDAGSPPESAFEALVSAAASVSIYALSTGHPIDLVRASADGIERIHEPGRAEVLRWLAGAEATDADLGPLVTVALARAGRRGTVVLCATDEGRAGAGLKDAVGAVQASGSRAIAVVARGATWARGRARRTPGTVLDGLGARRSVVRVVECGKDLLECLQ